MLYALQFVKPSHDVPRAVAKRVEKLIGQFVGFSSSDNHNAEFSVSVSYSLSEWSDAIWVTTSKEVAERVAASSSEWYNADFDAPENKYVGALKVVELVVK